MKRFVVLAVTVFPAAMLLGACGSSTKSETIKLIGQPKPNTFFIDNPPKGTNNGPPSPGDVFGIEDKLTKAGKPYGTDGGSCVVITPMSANCNVTALLPQGSVVVAGLDDFAQKQSPLAIVGGTGKYKNARGYIDVGNSQDDNAPTALTLHITY